MKKTLLPLIFLFLASFDVSGQYCTNPNMVWGFGSHAGLNFTTGSPVTITTPISILEGCSSVSDLAGSPLFYTDGKVVWDRTSTIMPHGASIVSYLTSDAAQGAQIVPIAGTSLYYIFSGNVYTTGHLSYTMVNMALNGGYGDVDTTVMGISMGVGFAEKLTATLGDNCNVWLITHRRDSAVFWVYNITTAGISAPVVSSIGTFNYNYAGVMKVCPNRHKIALQNCEGSVTHGTELYDFDPSTGIVSNCQVLDATGNNYGAEFSSDNTKLYSSTLSGGTVYQYDVSLSTTTAIVASKTSVGTSSSAGDFKLAPDNKIYIARNGSSYLDCINSPNVSGTGCGFTSNALLLATGTHSEYGLPNMVITVAPNDTLYTHHDTSICIPIGGAVTIAAHDTNFGSVTGTCVVPSYLWNDGVTTTRTRNITSAGIYWVGIYNGCGLVIDTIHAISLYADTVTGATSVCSGSSITWAATIGGGIWSSTSTSIATVGSASGILTGVSPGTMTITYIAPSACPFGANVTVNPAPTAIAGILSVCSGATTPLSDGSSGGTWSSSNTAIATVTSTGLVTGILPGTSTITYSLASGCPAATAIVTVNPLPLAITGTTHVCAGATTTLSDANSGGTWSSANTLIAPAGTLNGIVTGILAGFSTTISYTLPTGCLTTTSITVNPTPSAIYGPGSLCAGSSASLFDISIPGTWSSSNTAIATVGTSGILTGITAGTTIVSYTLPPGCSTTTAISVNPLPAAITGITNICIGGTTALADTTAGGAWTSSNTIVAAVDPFAGVVTGGVATGNVTISYTLGSGCAATATVTVNLGPLPINGILSLCTGGTTYLSDDIGGGVWSSDNSAVATVDSFGSVYGLSTGTATISYALGSCTAAAIVTVNPLPFLIIGPSTMCVGQTATLSDVSTGGTWSTGSAHITLGPASGFVNGTSAGEATITYTLPTGCTITKTMTVDTSPGTITGTTHVCAGLITTLSDGGGGTWSSSNTGIATIGPAGVVSGVTAGTTVITYSIGVSCSTSATVTVNPLPSAISGTAGVCAGSTTALSGGTGTWSSGGAAIATVGATGVVSGVTGGTAVITFTLPTGCAATRIVTVEPLPLTITGAVTVCPGATTTLNDLTTGGTWSSGNTGIATTGPTSDIVSGVTPGTSIITYTAPGTGCARAAVVTVNALPAAIPPTGGMCSGATATLTDATSGGVWSSGPGAFATVTATGTVRGVTAGTATISYTLGTGCARTTIVTVNPLPIITGPTAECVGATMSETPVPTGGTWSITTTSAATIGPAGIVTGVTTGTTVITYTSAAGCKAMATITISLSPTAITGPYTVCANDTMSLGNTVGGGVWSSSNTGVATIGSLTPVVTGVAAGTTIITYSLGTTGCTVTKNISVNPAPAAITGGANMCAGAATTLADAATGGIWSTAAAAIATVTTAGVVTGAATGTTTVSYVLSITGCSASDVVTVNPTPLAVTGTFHVCAGSTTTLSDVVTGGTWASSNTVIASTDAAGILTGAAPGTATITYSLGAGCAVTKAVTVDPTSAITGSVGICVGATTTLSDAISGGTWSSGTTVVATINATGVVTGIIPGTSTITYTTTAGCATEAMATVNLAPSAISGILHVCAGATTALGNTAGGGIWTSSNTATATVGPTGIVAGIIHGTSTITYSLGSGCTVTAVVTVNPAPAAITGAGNSCAGLTAILSDVTSGGTWSPTTGGIATVNSTGIVSGIAAGTAVVSYTIIGGCAASVIVTVNPLPLPISGAAGICVGQATDLTDDISGGTWSSSNSSVATIGMVSGAVGSTLAGTTSITYILPTGCLTTTTLTVNAIPAPISGSTSVCIGSITSLSDPTGTGTWNSSNTAVATISATGIVSGTALGTSTISYTAGGCPATVTVTINSLPGAISGMARVCAGATTALSDLPDGGTWSSSLAGIATVDETSGIVSGVAAGMATIAYSMGAGCTVLTIVTVDAVPLPISGVTEVCLGYTTPLSDAPGGVWSSSNTSVATITGSGVVSGAAGGPSTISYTNSAGCAATRLVTVVAVPPVLGVSNMCAFSTTLPLYDSAAGGFWTSTLASISSSGVMTPYSAGGVTITYTLPLGCYTTAALTINPLPGPVTGLNHVCLGNTIHLSDTSSGGTWSSGNTAVAHISGGGAVSGLAAGVSTISYTLGTGCAATETVTVEVFPAAGTISGSSVVCAGFDIVLSDAAAGGAWSTSNTAAAVIGGVVSGVSAGTDIISYTINNSCGAISATKTVTINPLPVAGTIAGPSNVCIGDSIVLADLALGGVWSSITLAASVGSTGSLFGGVVSGVSAGVDTIKYTVTNGCGTAFTSKTVTVNPLPEAGTILGIDSICLGITFPLADTATGGIWNSSNGRISISGAGIINAVSPGADTITYAVTNTCGTATTSYIIAVKTGPVAGVITGGATICSGSKDTLTGSPTGGGWSSSNGNATVTPVANGIVITGVSAGADTIAYTMTNECGGSVAIFPVTVYTIDECDSMTGVTTPPFGKPRTGNRGVAGVAEP